MTELRKGICKVSVSSLTKSTYTHSVLVTQILFGEKCTILDRSGKFLLLETSDKLVGWALNEHFIKVSEHDMANHSNIGYSLDISSAVVAEEFHINIPFGSTLLNFDGLTSTFPHEKFTFNGQVIFPNKENITPKVLARLSRKLINAPYLKGGMTIFGLDNINLIYLIYKICGYHLSRDVTELVEMGESIDFVQQVQIGDIAYFENKHGNISHAGIIIGSMELLHVHGVAKVDYMDHYGIYSKEKKRYTHRLRLVKRIFPTFSNDSIQLLKDKKEITNQIKMF